MPEENPEREEEGGDDDDLYNDPDLVDDEQDEQLKAVIKRTAKGDKVSTAIVEDYVRHEIRQREVFMNLPFTLLYFCVFVLMITWHEQLTNAAMVQRLFRNMLAGTTYEGISYTSGHKDIEDIDTKEDVWTFLNEVVMGIYIPTEPQDEDKYRVLRYNQLIGGVLVQQLRRDKVLCSTQYPAVGPFPTDGSPNPLMANFQCYPSSSETKECFGDPAAVADMTGWCPDAAREKEYLRWNISSGGGRRLDQLSEGTSDLEVIQESERRLSGYFPDGGGTGGSGEHGSGTPTSENYYNVYFHEYQGNTAAKAKLAMMQNNGWIDFHTSWVGIRALVFNPDLGMFAHVTVHIYMPPSGMFKAHIMISSFAPEPYQYMSLVAVDATWFFLLLWFTIRTIKNLAMAIKSKSMRTYFRTIWNYIDVLSVLGGFVCACLVVILLSGLDDLKAKAMAVRLAEPLTMDTNGQPIIPSQAAATAYELLVSELQYAAIGISNYLTQLRILLCWYTLMSAAKFLQAFSAQPRLAVITDTLLRAQEDLIHFGIVWIIVQFAFVVSGMFLFGRKMWNFSSLWHSFMSCFRMMLGDYDFEELIEEVPITGAIWFWLFTFLMVFVVLNILMAIIMDTYTEVKSEAESSKYIWITVWDMLKESKDNATGKTASNQEIVRACQNIPEENINADMLQRYVGTKCTEEQAKVIIAAAVAREEEDLDKGISITSAMQIIGWLKISFGKMTGTLEQILTQEIAENDAAMGPFKARLAEIDREGKKPGEEEAPSMSISEGQDRLKRIAMRMEKMEEFMQESMQYATFRSKDVRNRMAVIEDLIRGQRDATMMKVERDIWDNMPPSLTTRR